MYNCKHYPVNAGEKDAICINTRKLDMLKQNKILYFIALNQVQIKSTKSWACAHLFLLSSDLVYLATVNCSALGDGTWAAVASRQPSKPLWKSDATSCS